MFSSALAYIGLNSNEASSEKTESEQTYPLPAEMYNLIFQNLNIKNQLSCRLVSRHWNRLIDEESSLWPTKLKETFNVRQHPGQISNKDRFFEIYDNLKTENFVLDESKNPLTEYYQQYYFNRLPENTSFAQKNLFRIQGDQIFFAIGRNLFILKNFGKNQTIFAPHDQRPVVALEIKGNRLITSGMNQGNKSEIKVWNIDDLTCIATIPTNFLAKAFHIIDENQFISGNKNGNCFLWKLDNNEAMEIAKLQHPHEKEPITFIHYIHSKGSDIIITRHADQSMYFWTQNEEAKWSSKQVQDKSNNTKRIFCAVKDVLFEAVTDHGVLRINGTVSNQKILNMNIENFHLIGRSIQWMQYDNGSLYIASEEKIHRLDFSPRSMVVKKDHRKLCLKKLVSDLRWTKSDLPLHKVVKVLT